MHGAWPGLSPSGVIKHCWLETPRTEARLGTSPISTVHCFQPAMWLMTPEGICVYIYIYTHYIYIQTWLTPCQASCSDFRSDRLNGFHPGLIMEVARDSERAIRHRRHLRCHGCKPCQVYMHAEPNITWQYTVAKLPLHLHPDIHLHMHLHMYIYIYI